MINAAVSLLFEISYSVPFLRRYFSVVMGLWFLVMNVLNLMTVMLRRRIVRVKPAKVAPVPPAPAAAP